MIVTRFDLQRADVQPWLGPVGSQTGQVAAAQAASVLNGTCLMELTQGLE